MNPRFLLSFAIAALMLFVFVLWPSTAGSGDVKKGLWQNLHPAGTAAQRQLSKYRCAGFERTAEGMAVRGIDGSNHFMVYQSRYHPTDWSGDVLAYLARWENDRLVIAAQQWRAADQFRFPGLDWRERCIVTYGGSGIEGQGVPFRWNDLSSRQQIRLLGGTPTETPDSSKGRELVNYLRGKPSIRFRRRSSQLGDIMNSSPVLAGRILFVGSNDGMLHAFDAFTGRERFAYVPNLVLDHLRQLGAADYCRQPHYYVDAAPTVGQVQTNAGRRSTYLIGGLGRGGRGYYCLLLDTAERKPTAQDTGDSQAAAGDDPLGNESSEETVCRMVRWEYPAAVMADDAMDNDDDGMVDEPGESDPHLGYSFSQAYAVNANAPSGRYRPVVIFGNGYNSPEGEAVLYVLDAHSGHILRKIHTAARGRNGLSTPALVDVDLDRRIDYAYAGDLQGNLWKFDLTAAEPEHWGVAYTGGVGAQPLPLFQATGRSITGRPDVMALKPVCNPDARGVMVIFGTGAHPGYGSNRTQPNAIFGIRDSGAPVGEDDNPADVFAGDTEPMAGWVVALPPGSAAAGRSAERVTGKVAIRGGKALVTSYLPGAYPGAAHGAESRIHVLDACSGVPAQDADHAGNYPLGINRGISSDPVILKNPSQPQIDHLLAWDSEGGIIQTAFIGERQGRVSWRQDFK